MRFQPWIFALAAPALLSGCNVNKGILKVTDAYVQMNPVEGAPSALYFTVHGGPKDTELLSVVSEYVIKIEMHESGKDAKTGAMKMTPVEKVAIPAETNVEFKPGGRHVMLWGMNRVPVQTGKLEVEFVFGNGERQPVEVPIRKMGEAAPATNASHDGGHQ